METRTIAVTGASGLIGTALCKSLRDDGCRVLELVRREVKDPEREVYWKPSAGEIDASRLEGVDGVVHLAGVNIADKRWTPEFKQKIVDSRVQGTELLAGAIAALADKPRVLVQASAIGYYGDRGDAVMTEESSAGDDFLAKTCVLWEASSKAAWEAGVRVAQLRIGVVMSPEGGALKELLPKFNLGGGATLGDGKQWMSWVALPDVVGALRFCLDNEGVHGAVNGAAPGAVTNREFTKTLAGVLSRPALLTLPKFAVRAMFGEMGDALLLSSTRVAPTRLEEAGYRFKHPELEPALRALLEK
ncbi:Epimerase family protein [Pirellulimonas nuda]|uniref:Epimerase family protein n=1 Tax=Pirellulimonas nuda TaxID=2528009 RepID=A0A518D5J9_9BACT|nr:TIGR01777 family oxidoreductase [Pirellulimonas nuda]QDU86739.1 Epimerase family protein [Pirellulimonas nuda]